MLTLNQKSSFITNPVIPFVMMAMIMELLLFPYAGFSKEGVNMKEMIKTDLKIFASNSQKSEVSANITAVNMIAEEEESDIAWTKNVVMTAYNSEPGQTDDSPCITANGFNVCEHGIEDTIAANFLKFGTQVRIPELFGDRVFVVRDRMNKRYTDRVDVWLLSHENAIDFGVQYATIEILNQ